MRVEPTDKAVPSSGSKLKAVSVVCTRKTLFALRAGEYHSIDR